MGQKYVLPFTANHNDKSIREYTKEDFVEAIETIKDAGYERDGVMRQYSDNSISHFQNLIYYVVFQCAVVGICPLSLQICHKFINFSREIIS